MIRIFFKTIWNNRRRNILVFIELFMISLVLVNITVYLVNMLAILHIKNCYDTHNVILVNISKKNDEDEKITEQSFLNLKKVFSSNSFVESVSISNYANPYNYNIYSTDFKHDSDHFNLALRQVDLDYAKVMKITPLKGRWFDETDIGKAVPPIIISRDIDEKYFKGDALGKRIGEDKNLYEIVAVVDHFKRSDIEKPYSFGFMFKDKVNAKSFWETTMLIRTKENKTSDMLAIAESQVYSTLNPENWTIDSLNSLENMRDQQNAQNYQRNYLTVIIALFIMINVFLGTIGILWYNTNLRIHEIGIKRALGSTGIGIKRLLITENMVIAGVGLLVVILIILQIPTLVNGGPAEPGVLSRSIWISAITMIILVLLSTWIPASIASKIRPATALKTE
jgi:ABC-type transport system, involved in lipoprotein release, permease component